LRFVADIHVDRHDLEVVAAEFGLEAVERGHFDPARGAPGGPQVEEDGLAGEIGQRQRTAVRRLEGERSSNRSAASATRKAATSPVASGAARAAAASARSQPARIAMARAPDIYRDRPGNHAGDGGDADQRQSAVSDLRLRHVPLLVAR
jgi:hypothetical protein